MGIYYEKIYLQIRGQGVNLCARLSYLLFLNMLNILVRVKKLRRFILLKFICKYVVREVNLCACLSYLLFCKYATFFALVKVKKIYFVKIYLQIRGQEVNLCARLSYLLLTPLGINLAPAGPVSIIYRSCYIDV